MKVMVKTAVVRRAKRPPNRHNQQINTQPFTGWMSSCR